MKEKLKELFTTYDEARKLKDLGFNEVCAMYFSIYGELSPTAKGTVNEEEHYRKYEIMATAPTLDQAIEFMLQTLDMDSDCFYSIQVFANGGGRIVWEEEVQFESKRECLNELFKLYDKQLEYRKLYEDQDED